MNIKEMIQIVEMLDEEWDLGKKLSKSKGKICAWIYLFEILEYSEHLIIEKDKEKVIGICGYSKASSKKYKFRKKFFHFLKNVLFYSPFIKNKNMIIKYNNNYDYTPDELKDYFDGEITILIVDKNNRRKNIGKKLALEVFEKAKEDNLRNLQILTDESCNFKFYDSIGCKKIYETTIKNMEPESVGKSNFEKAYIYEKKL